MLHVNVHEASTYIEAFRLACAQVPVLRPDYHSAVVTRKHESKLRDGRRVYRFTFLVS
jgi:hypothetical protein